MDRLSRPDPGMGLALLRGPDVRCRPGPLSRATRLGPRPRTRSIYWYALATGAALGAMLAEANPATEHFDPFAWYPTPGEARPNRVPAITRLPPLPLPGPEPAREPRLGLLAPVPTGPLQSFRREDDADGEHIEASAFGKAAPGEPPPAPEPPPPEPVASLDPAPLGPARPLELPVPGARRILADATLSRGPLGPPATFERPAPRPPPPPDPALAHTPLGPPQRLQLAQAYPNRAFSPDPLGPLQKLQLSRAFATPALQPEPLGPPRPVEQPEPGIAAILAPTPLGPLQALRRAVPDRPAPPVVAAVPGTEGAAAADAGPSTPRTTSGVRSPDRVRRRTAAPAAAPWATTGSVGRGPAVMIKDGTVVLRVRY